MRPSLLLQLAGLLHLGLLWAGAAMPRAIDLRAHLAPLPQAVRRVFWLYYSSLGFCLVGFGALSFFLAADLASGTPLARSVCAFLSGFWTIRLAAALWVLDVRPWRTTRARRLGNGALTIAFVLLTAIYAWVALKGDSL